MKRIVLLRIDTDPVVRLCSAVAPMIVPDDPIDGGSYKYLGGGKLVEVPELEQVINGTAQRADITVSGVSPAAIGFMREESASLKGASIWIGAADQDDDYQITDVEWAAELRCDFASSESTYDKRSISISIGSDDTDRSKAPVAFWTPQDQARRSPTDRFFDHVPSINSGTSRRFGPNGNK